MGIDSHRAAPIRVAMIGAGKFGARRAIAAAHHAGTSFRVVADVIPERANMLGQLLGCASTADCENAATREDVDVVIVSTPTHRLVPMAKLAMEAGKHVLVEKPCGRSAAEVFPLIELAARNGIRFKAGYNHRYHPALQKAHSLFVRGDIGRLLFMRCCYGHGGREGYEKEWRTQAGLSGGGELLDQGVHALDLFQWFAGRFEEVTGFVTTAFWPIAPADDNAFALLRTAGGCVAQLHASWTNWKNIFQFEVFGEAGSLSISGLGGSYGTERLTVSSRQASGAPPEEESFDFSEGDRSLELEWADFLRCIAEGCDPPSSAIEAWETLMLVGAIYDSNSTRGARNYGEPAPLLLPAVKPGHVDLSVQAKTRSKYVPIMRGAK
jgi:predicted dehydrogenase